MPLSLFVRKLATVAGPLAGEELHGLCFLLERVEITADCLAGGNPSLKASSSSSPEAFPDVFTEPPTPGDELCGPPSMPLVTSPGMGTGRRFETEKNDGIGDSSSSSVGTSSMKGVSRVPRQVGRYRRHNQSISVYSPMSLLIILGIKGWKYVTKESCTFGNGTPVTCSLHVSLGERTQRFGYFPNVVCWSELS